MDRGLVSPDWQPLVKLLHSVLTRVGTDLAEVGPPVHLAITSGPSDALLLLASVGEGAELVEAQGHELGGPLPDAVATGLPVVAADVWSDPRWPRLTRDTITALKPALRATWGRIQGVAVMPAGHGDHSMVALSCSLTGPADERTLDVLARYRQLLESALAVAYAAGIDGSEQVLQMLQSRAVIEQAKGVIIAATGCAPHDAWRALRTASQHRNIKLRDVATALVELLSNAPAEHPEGLPIPDVKPTARDAAIELWKALDDN